MSGDVAFGLYEWGAITRSDLELGLELDIESDLAVPIARVDCSDAWNLRDGDVTLCSVHTRDGGSVVIDVTIEDDAGNDRVSFLYRLPDGL
jgi:hypothetical protein